MEVSVRVPHWFEKIQGAGVGIDMDSTTGDTWHYRVGWHGLDAWSPYRILAAAAGRDTEHFDFSGTPDSWDSKQSLLYPAGVGVILYLVMIVLSRFPHLNNYLVAITESNAEKQYRMAVTLMLTLANVMIWMFTYIVWQTIRTALGYSEGLGEQFLYVILLVTLGPIVVYLIASLRARDIPPRKD